MLTCAASGQGPCDIFWRSFNPDPGPDRIVTQLASWSGRLVARGQQAGTLATKIAAYDGTTWTDISAGFTLGTGIQAEPQMGSIDGRLYVAGSLASETNPSRAAPGQVWDGAAWHTIPIRGLYSGGANRLWATNGRIYAFGSIFFPDAQGNLGFNRTLAAFNGYAWSTVGSQIGPSLNSNIRSLVDVGGEVFIAGGFNTINTQLGQPGITVRNAARLTGGVWSEAGTGFNSLAMLAVLRGEVYAAGSFTASGDGATPLLHVARWTGSTWEQVAGGITGTVSAFTAGDDGRGPALFLSASGHAVNTDPAYPPTVAITFLVRFDGTGFTSLPTGTAPAPMQSVTHANSSAVYVGAANLSNGPGGPATIARLGPDNLTDTDADGLPDAWESFGGGFDVNCDGNPDIDLFAIGASPTHKDIFVEVDAMSGMIDQAAIDAVIAAFEAAPVLNPDGTTGIRLHVQLDRTDLPLQSFPGGFIEFQRIKATEFGTAFERSLPNARARIDARRKVFRYCLFARDHSGGTSSGLSELPGNDFMVTLGHPDWAPLVTTSHRAGTFMHELGHTLGLYHGGAQFDPDNDRRFNYKPNFHSIMNYLWQFPDRPGWRLDFSRSVLPPLDETALLEPFGLFGDPAALVLIGPPRAAQASEVGPIDYNRNHVIDTLPVAADINHLYPHDSASPGDTLLGFVDWEALHLNFRDSDAYADGAAAPTPAVDEMTYEVFASLRELSSPPCAADFNADGDLNADDLGDYINCYFNNPPCDRADFNADANIDADDLGDFINAYFAGCS